MARNYLPNFTEKGKTLKKLTEFTKNVKNNYRLYLFGFVSGVVNGLFGAGGGVFAVKGLKQERKSQQVSQATSIMLMFFLCVVSLVSLFIKGEIELSTLNVLWVLIPFGLAGAFLGTVIMQKVRATTLKKVFAIFVLIAGIKFLI